MVTEGIVVGSEAEGVEAGQPGGVRDARGVHAAETGRGEAAAVFRPRAARSGAGGAGRGQGGAGGGRRAATAARPDSARRHLRRVGART